MFRRFLPIIAVIVFGFFIGFFLMGKLTSISKPPVVAITQIAPHPSLDQIRQGIIETLMSKGIKESDILFQNAQGSQATALQIAQKFVSLKPKIIIPITTPSAQSVYSQAKPAGIPVIFSAVSDPEGAKLFDPEEKSELIAGVSDLSPVDQQASLIREILPKAKNVGVIFNAGEANSVTLIDKFEAEAKKNDLTIIRATISSTNDVSSATNSLIGKVDAIYIPNDNTTISALESVLKITNNNKLPVFTADPQSVSRGAIASISHNQYDLGRQTGLLAMSYLSGEHAISVMGVQTPKNIELVINLKVAHTFGIELDDNLLKRSTYTLR